MDKNKSRQLLYNGALSSSAGFTAMLLIYLVIIAMGQGILNGVGLTSGIWYDVITCLFLVMAVGGVIWYYSFNRKENVLLTVNAKKFNPIFILFSILLAVGMLLGFGFINNLISMGIESIGGNVSNTTLKMDTFGEFVVCVITLALVPAVFEEIFFRGFMLKGLNGMSVVMRIITVSLCFAFYHAQATKFIYQFIYGCALAILTVYSGSVIPAIIAHFINNFGVLLLEYVGLYIDLFAWYVILIGIVVIAIFCVCLYFYIKKKVDYQSINNAEREEKVHKNFWAPFGCFGVGVCLMIIILNVVG